MVATHTVLGLLEEHNVNPGELLARHQSGDWDDVGPEDRRTNDRDLREGEQQDY